MTNDELRELMHRLQLDCAEAPRLIYVFYETADGLVNKKDSLKLKQYLAGWPVVLGE